MTAIHLQAGTTAVLKNGSTKDQQISAHHPAAYPANYAFKPL